jgi:gas vesicle protein
MAELATSYAAIVKTNKNGDGTMTVYGKATDSSIDIDQQICDETWLKEAMPQWMVSGGNIREQHSSIAAGVATEYEAKEDGHYITALVVDPVSVKKVETGVLKGFSIGIRGPRVIRDTKAAGGRIVDGQIVEISLVDRPANPNAKLMLAKAAEGGELEVVKQITIPSPNAVADLVKFDPDQERDANGRFGSGGGGSEVVSGGNREDSATRDANDQIAGEALGHIGEIVGGVTVVLANPDSDKQDRNNAETAKINIDEAKQAISDSASARQSGDHERAAGHMLTAANSLRAAAGDVAKLGLDGSKLSESSEKFRDLADAQYALSEKSTNANLVKFDPDQERDDNGRFGGGGGGSSSDKPESDKTSVNETNFKGISDSVADIKSAADDLKEVHGSSIEQAVIKLEDRANDAIEAIRNVSDSAASRSSASSAVSLLERQVGVVAANARNIGGPTDDIASRIGDAGDKIMDHITSLLDNNKSSTSDSKVEPMDTINKFDPDQERDDSGRFGSGGGSGGSDKPSGDGGKNYNLDESVVNSIQNRLEDANNEIGYVFDSVEGTDDEDVVSDIGTAIDAATEAMALDNHVEAERALTEAIDICSGNSDRIGGLDTVKDELDTALDSLINNKSIIATLVKADRSASQLKTRAKNLVGSLVKFDQKKYDQACAALAGLIVVEANEMKAGSEEVRSIELLLASIKALHEWYEGEVAEGEVMGGSLEPEVEELYLAADPDKPVGDKDKPAADGEMCPDCDLEKSECKCADKSATLNVDDEVVSSIIDKAVANAKASVVEEIGLLKSALEAERVKAIQLEGELETAKKAVAPTGPKRSAGLSVIDTNALLQKAAEYNQKAKATTDPILSKGYRELAKDLINNSQKGE